MLKNTRRVCDIDGNMQKAILFFIFCVLLCEVSPKVPIRKEDLLNKKAALSKQLSPNSPKWDEIATKLHTKDKPTQNKSKTLMNLLKVVTAREIDVPNVNSLKNGTNTNTTVNNNATTNQDVTNANETVKNNTIRRIYLNNHQANATLTKTPKKYSANETIGGKLAFFLLKNAPHNTTKEKTNAPEIIAPTMIPIFKPMPSSTRNTIPQPLTNELIRKDNFVPKELDPQQLKNYDHFELNPGAFNPLQNKAILNPLQASQEMAKEQQSPNYMNGMRTQNENSEHMEQGLNSNFYSPFQNGLNPQTETNVNPSKIHQSDITLNYVDPQSAHQVPNESEFKTADAQNQLRENSASSAQNTPSNIANFNPQTLFTERRFDPMNTAVLSQYNLDKTEPNLQRPNQNSGLNYDLKISPPLGRNTNPQGTPNYVPNEFPKHTVSEQLNPNYENMKPNLNQHPGNQIFVNQNDIRKYQKDSVNQHEVVVNQNHFNANQNNVKVFSVNENNANQNKFGIHQNDYPVPKNSINTVNGGPSSPVLPSDSSNRRVIQESSPPITSGFLPCLKASDVLDDFGTAPSCCQKNKPNLNSVTEKANSNLPCEKTILLDEPSDDESVAIVFKPKNISLLKFYGDLLKKITLTVLVPYHISKLTS